MADWKLFLNQFNANIRKLSADDGLVQWKEFVDKADEKTLMLAIETVGADCALQRRSGKNVSVKLPDIRMTYFELWRNSRNGENGAICSICGRSGSVVVVQFGNPGQILDPRNPQPCRERDIGVFMAPCVCKHSQKLWPGAPYHRRQENVRYRFTARYENYKGVDFVAETPEEAARKYVEQCVKMFEESGED